MSDHFLLNTEGKLESAEQHAEELGRLISQLRAGPPISSETARAQIAHFVTDPNLTLDEWSQAIEDESEFRRRITVTFTMSRTIGGGA